MKPGTRVRALLPAFFGQHGTVVDVSDDTTTRYSLWPVWVRFDGRESLSGFNSEELTEGDGA